jgi:phenylpyruvate tautomerase PptA (4-oxalocrotonate tautomerase family)
MPLVKVNLLKGRSAEEKNSIAASIQTALVSTLEVPEADRYQLFNEYDGESFASYRRISRLTPASASSSRRSAISAFA